MYNLRIWVWLEFWEFFLNKMMKLYNSDLIYKLLGSCLIVLFRLLFNFFFKFVFFWESGFFGVRMKEDFFVLFFFWRYRIYI